MTEMTPEDAEAWEWDEGNEYELAKHRVTPEEVEQAWQNTGAYVRNTNRADSSKIMGATDGGRALSVIVVVDSIRKTMRPVTGWDMPTSDKTRYFNGGNP
jgi:uncharacterized DUF497 family protein